MSLLNFSYLHLHPSGMRNLNREIAENAKDDLAELLNERLVSWRQMLPVNVCNVSVGYHGDSVWGELSQRMLLGSILG